MISLILKETSPAPHTATSPAQSANITIKTLPACQLALSVRTEFSLMAQIVSASFFAMTLNIFTQTANVTQPAILPLLYMKTSQALDTAQALVGILICFGMKI